ncbi:MAG: hypothetical protein FWD15_03260 [Alphaproteobacteria bacterium]|nr:hypothetical protein [Alphaproteobacteria bacterium]
MKLKGVLEKYRAKIIATAAAIGSVVAYLVGDVDFDAIVVAITNIFN